MVGIPEVIAVGGLVQPTLLASPLAGRLTGRLSTVLLARAVAEVGKKIPLAMQAFAVTIGRLHRDQKLPRLAVSPAAAKLEQTVCWKKTNEENRRRFFR
jgi:hypothetical protein